MTKPKIFELGLVMAGAISAGAYTAGVLDFLFRAIRAHNEAVGSEGGPNHKIVVKAMSGTSAGGVSAALAVASLIKGFDDPPVIKNRTSGDGEYSYVLTPLHQIWVEQLTLLDNDLKRGFLTTGDIDDQEGRVFSLLNSKHIDEAASAALENISWSQSNRYDFLPEHLHLFVTGTNITGVPYRVRFVGNQTDAGSGHGMLHHAHWRHFNVTGLGTEPLKSDWLEIWGDHGIKLDVTEFDGKLIPFNDIKDPLWYGLRNSAIATGAFPIGLAARHIRARISDYTSSSGRLAWPLDVDPKAFPAPDWPSDIDEEADFIAIDGGVINNEPFELTRFALRRKIRPYDPSSDPNSWQLGKNPRQPVTADRSVIMIDPFPEAPRYDPSKVKDDAGRDILAVIGALKPTLLNAARFKTNELAAAANLDVRSRFLIAPSSDRGAGEHAIASGLLGGFGGFFARTFREHDFILGQRNCQRFLQQRLTLDANNPIFHKAGQEPKDVNGEPKGTLGIEQPIIQLTGDALNAEIKAPIWPAIEPAKLDVILAQLQTRLEMIGDRAVRSYIGNWFARRVARRAWVGLPIIKSDGLRGKSSTYIKRVIGAELIRRDQHGGFLRPDPSMPDNEWALYRTVLAALMAPGPELRTAEGLALKTGLEIDDVEKVLKDSRLHSYIWKGPKIRKQYQGYTLEQHKPPFRRRWNPLAERRHDLPGEGR